MKTLYAILTQLCNLDCSHCDIKKKKETTNKNLFLKQLNKNWEHIILFGGEPTLNLNLLKETYSLADSISTNLCYDLNSDLIYMLNSLSVSTSWNPNRFSPSQYTLWIKNVKQLRDRPHLLITLTPDLIYDNNDFFLLLNSWDGYFSSIEFEQLSGANLSQDYYIDVDKWLLALYEKWNLAHTKCLTFERAKNGWLFLCGENYTLYPSGILKKGCPQYRGETPRKECLSCAFSYNCVPCILQKQCTRPNLLIRRIQDDK